MVLGGVREALPRNLLVPVGRAVLDANVTGLRRLTLLHHVTPPHLVNLTTHMWSFGVSERAALPECPPSPTPVGCLNKFDSLLADSCLNVGRTEVSAAMAPPDPIARIPTPCRAWVRDPCDVPATPRSPPSCLAAATLNNAGLHVGPSVKAFAQDCFMSETDKPWTSALASLEYGTIELAQPLRTLLDEVPRAAVDFALSRAIRVLCPARALSLETSIPVTSYQQSVLDLQALLPPRPQIGTCPCDWLDADLSHVLRRPDVKPHLRAAFQSVKSYWTLQDPCMPVAVHVYTDGTATTDPAQFERFAHQCAWCFCVWLSMPDGADYFYGHAVHSSVSPESPYHAGEILEDALTAEQLALFWCLTWLVDSASAFQAPVVVHSDCQTAARGAFGQAQPASTGQPVGRSLHEAVTILRHVQVGWCR